MILEVLKEIWIFMLLSLMPAKPFKINETLNTQKLKKDIRVDPPPPYFSGVGKSFSPLSRRVAMRLKIEI